MMWLPFALLAPALWAISNVLDGRIVDHGRLDAVTLSTVAALFAGLPALAMLALGSAPGWPDAPTTGAAVLAGVSGVLVYVPYYSALEHGSTAGVTLSWNLAPALVAVGAAFAFHERLGPAVYLGIACLVLSATLAADQNASRGLPKRMVIYMAVASLLLAVETLALQVVYDALPFASGIFFVSVVSLAIGCITAACYPPARRTLLSTRRGGWALLATSQGLDAAAGISIARGISLGSGSLVKAVGGLQPVFVLLVEQLLRRGSVGADVRCHGTSSKLRMGMAVVAGASGLLLVNLR